MMNSKFRGQTDFDPNGENVDTMNQSQFSSISLQEKRKQSTRTDLKRQIKQFKSQNLQPTDRTQSRSKSWRDVRILSFDQNKDLSGLQSQIKQLCFKSS